MEKFYDPRTGLYDIYEMVGDKVVRMAYDPKHMTEEEVRKAFDAKIKECFTWSDENVWRIVVQRDSFTAPSIYVVRLDDHKWCIHKGQLVLEDEGYVGKIISIAMK